MKRSSGFPIAGGARCRQRGVTLIELLVSMALGVFIVAGTIQIFIGSKQTYRTQVALSRLQENGRFALDMLQQSLRMTGYRNNPAMELYKAFENDDTTGLMQGQVIRGFDGAGSGSNADHILLRYQSPASNSRSNCLAIAVSGDTLIGFSLDDGGALRCSVNDVLVQPLVSGIHDMELVYGVDLDDDQSADTYLGAAAITANNRWLHIVSVKIALLISSDEDNIAGASQTYTFPPHGFGIEPQHITATDRRLYRVFHGTINLRNQTR